MRNLLSNAIKFTDPGAVGLTLEIQPRAGAIALVVTRHRHRHSAGAASRTLIFEAFHQGDGALTSRRFGGTGLGLSISRQLAGLLGGEHAP